LVAAPLAAAELEANRAFWKDAERTRLPALVNRMQSTLLMQPAIIRSILKMAHVIEEPDREAVQVSALYSCSLDYWGVQLQRQGLLNEAAQSFEGSQRLNPENRSAQINLAANEVLRAHARPRVQSTVEVEANLGSMQSWALLTRTFGPIDDANCCFHLGNDYAEDSCYRQAIEQFARVQELAPDYPRVHERLAEALQVAKQRLSELKPNWPAGGALR
jgi:tetratricopeptide (TPR) repeat protein